MKQSNQTIESLIEQLPEERIPDESLFSIELGYWLLLLAVILIVITGFVIYKAFLKNTKRQLKLKKWQTIVEQELTDIKRIEQANSIIKLNINLPIENLKTLSGAKWKSVLNEHFPKCSEQTIEILANYHYKQDCKIANLSQFNHDIQIILEETINA